MILTKSFDRSHICSAFFKVTQKTCHSTAETLILMIMQKFCSLTHNNMPKLDYLFFDTPCTMTVIDLTKSHSPTAQISLSQCLPCSDLSPIPIFYCFLVVESQSQCMKSHFPSQKIGKSQFPFYPFRTLYTGCLKKVQPLELHHCSNLNP